jgi:hypothetical protein
MYNRTYKYMECLETFVADCNKRFFNIQEANTAIRKVEIKLDSIQVQVDKLNQMLSNPKKSNPTGLIDNAEFIRIMRISDKTSQNWRQNKVIQYSLIGGKIFYRISDIIELFEKNLRKSTTL